MTPLLLQKYQWSPEEDDFIRRYVEKVGEKENVDWPKCSKYLQEETQIYRSGKQNTLIKIFLVKVMENKFRDWSLITGRGGLQNGKIAGPKLFAPPPSRQGKTFLAPPFIEWKLFAPPLQYG